MAPAPAFAKGSAISASIFVPGRACLLGEHNDWAGLGGASLVVPLPVGVRITVVQGDALTVRTVYGRSTLSPDARGLEGDPNALVAAALRRVAARGEYLARTRLGIDSDLTPGRGFSSSAAVCVAVAKAMGITDPEAAAAVAVEAERDELGIGCGELDPLACAYGEALAIQWGPPRVVHRLGQPRLHLLAAAFPEGSPAAPVLASLRDPRARSAIVAWGELAAAGVACLERPADLGRLMDQAQDVWEDLDLPGLESPGLYKAVRALRAAGALGAKFCGAGGDRSVIALFPDAERLAAGAEAARAQSLEVVSPAPVPAG